jgi:hypothetical protein
MFARKLAGFSLACTLAASPAFAIEGYQPLAADELDPGASTSVFEYELPAPDAGFATDALPTDESVATGGETATPVEADS